MIMSEWKDKAMWRCPMPQGKTEREQQLELDLEQAKAENLRQEVAKMNEEQNSWRQIHIQAAIAAMQGILSNSTIVSSASLEDIAETAVNMADALILKLRQNDKV